MEKKLHNSETAFVFLGIIFIFVTNHTVMFDSFAFMPLFDGLMPDETEQLFGSVFYEVSQIAIGDVVALKGSQCQALLLLTEGTVRCENSVYKGEPVPVERMGAPGVISPGLLYAPDNRFPVHWVAESPSMIVSVPKNNWTILLQQDKRLLENFLALISDVTKPLSDKVIYRTFKTIKGKFSHYLLELSDQTGSDAFRLPLTQREMADLFGVTRPALARAIGEMSDEGSIYVERKQVKILFPEKLKQYIG